METLIIEAHELGAKKDTCVTRSFKTETSADIIMEQIKYILVNSETKAVNMESSHHRQVPNLLESFFFRIIFQVTLNVLKVFLVK